MNKIRNNFQHIKGKDCITSSLRNLVHYFGVNLSESMVFGIGMGFRFWYSQLEHESAFPVFIGQDTEIEKIFCKNFGLNFSVKQDNTGTILKNRLDNCMPTIIKADPYYLPYAWDDSGLEPMHFGEHVLLLVDYDKTHFFLSDIWHNSLTRVRHEELLAARTTKDGLPYLLPHARWFDITKMNDFKFEFSSISSILYDTCIRHLSEIEPYGIAGIKYAAQALPKFLADIYKRNKSELIYILKCITMRMYEGDDCTLFRGLYFDFLKEFFADSYQEITNISDLEKKIKNGWKNINNLLIKMSTQIEKEVDAEIKNILSKLNDSLLEVAVFEEFLCHHIIQQLRKK